MTDYLSVDRRGLLAGLAALPLLGAAPARIEGEPEALELPVPAMRRLSQTVWIAPIAPRVWITCFTYKLQDSWYPANGMIVIGDDGATIVDTGWTREQGDTLLIAARDLAHGKVARAIATHFHSDRTGGIAAMTGANIPTFANPLSIGLAQSYGDPVPQPVKGLEKAAVKMGSMELYFPGAGHALDNIVVWHSASRILFGGCLLKSVTAPSLGNTEDADLDAYRTTLDSLDRHYPNRRLTIPGHGTVSGDPIAKTRTLLANRSTVL